VAVTIDDVRALATGLPRSYEALIRGRVKFKVGQYVYIAFSRDETLMGFGFPKEEREAFLAAYPEKFQRPGPADMRYHWLVARLAALDRDELQELVFDAWRMVVPKGLRETSDEELRRGLPAYGSSTAGPAGGASPSPASAAPMSPSG
jgi:hypothetical protein